MTDAAAGPPATAAAARQHGRVMWWKPDKGYGRIVENGTGQIYFVHFTALKPGRQHLEPGRRVTFEFHGGRQDHDVPRAEAIEVLGKDD